MPLVLPILRLWLLFINVYGTFKVIKPPAPASSTKSGRNGQNLSARALQLRKRELKSRLAMWIVGACFLASESVLDRTASLVTPFYSELKSVVLLFLLITRSHGAEAIFLHLIHPFIRPYVPAIDNILAHLHSVFELLVLLFFIPLEYVSEWWGRPWRLPYFFQRKRSSDLKPDNYGGATSTPVLSVSQSLPSDEPGEGDNQVRSRLRPRKSQLQEAEQRAKTVFGQINEAQDRVRTRTRTRSLKDPNQQSSITAARVNVPDKTQQQQNGNGHTATGTGLRTRKNFLGRSSVYANTNPGSKTTGVHHLDPLTITQMAKTKAAVTSTLHNDKAPFATLPITEPSLRQQQQTNAYEIWMPPHEKELGSTQQQLQQRQPSPYRSPSPVYPPFPSAYPFTPRRRTDPSLQSPPPNHDEPIRFTRRSTTPSAGTRQNPDGKGKHPMPSSSSSSSSSTTSQFPESRVSNDLNPENFFQMALESSTHPRAPDSMDVDTSMTETMSTLNDSSATEGSMLGDTTLPVTPQKRRSNQSRKKDGTESLKRSLRIQANGNGTTSRDEFGFAVPSASTSVTSVAATLAAPKASPRRRQQQIVPPKKTLARVKPTLNSDGEVLSDDVDSENVKKKQKTKKSPVTKRSDSGNLVIRNGKGSDHNNSEPLQSKAGTNGKTSRNQADASNTDAFVSFRASRSTMNEVADSLRATKRS